MSYQLTMIIQSYVEENKRIKTSFTNDIKFNKIALVIEPFIDFKRNNEYYPKFEEAYNNLQFKTERINLVHGHIYNVFLHNLSSFVYITRLLDLKIKCTMEFENNIQLDCGEIILTKITIVLNSMKFLYNIPGDNFINSTELLNLNQISIKIFPTYTDKYLDFDNFVYIYFHNSIFLSYLPNELHWMSTYSKHMNNFIVEPTYYRRLTHFGQQCDPRVRPLFDDSLTDDCIMDCVRKRSIDAFNCIPFNRYIGFIRWKRDIMENHNILCNRTFNEQINIDKFIRKCINECQFDCEFGLYKITQFYDYNYNNKSVSGDIYIAIKIIPRSNLIVQYEEQYIMDGWGLIYKLGGVIGIWLDGQPFLYPT